VPPHELGDALDRPHGRGVDREAGQMPPEVLRQLRRRRVALGLAPAHGLEHDVVEIAAQRFCIRRC
jgi:hypothetical protein